MALLSVKDACKNYPVRHGFLSARKIWLSALRGVSLDIFSGETLGLVGESGCGKSTLSRLALGLEKPSSGQVFFEGQDLALLKPRGLRKLRPRMQIVFQDPATSLNPKMTIRQILREPFIIHGRRLGMDKEVDFLLRAVGLTAQQASRYPHQFSGGQRQRIGIARALALRPKLLLADEPVSALDVSIQAQILNLLQELKEEFGLTYIIIAHDLSVITHLATRLAIMYLGKIVEIALPDMLRAMDKLHPYTTALWSSSPTLDPGHPPQTMPGEMPSPLNPPQGCGFHTRCPQAQPVCREQEPALMEKTPGHFCACHFR